MNAARKEYVNFWVGEATVSYKCHKIKMVLIT